MYSTQSAFAFTSCALNSLVIDRIVVAYFYAVVEKDFDPSKVAGEISKAIEAPIVKLEVACVSSLATL